MINLVKEAGAFHARLMLYFEGSGELPKGLKREGKQSDFFWGKTTAVAKRMYGRRRGCGSSS